MPLKSVLRTLYSVIYSCHAPTFCMCAVASASHLSTFAPAIGRFAPLHGLVFRHSLHSHPYNYHLDFYHHR